MTNKMESRFERIVPISQMAGDTAEDTELLRVMYQEAARFLSSFRWCRSVRDAFFGLGVGGVVGVFLFNLEPARAGVDQWLWVVVGDLPSAYIVTDRARNPVSALEAYIEEMRAWVSAARSQASLEGVIPVNVKPTDENVKMLESRLNFLERKILPQYREEA